MATYLSWRNYFEQLAQKNKLVNHLGNTNNGKAFFSANIEEFISGTANALPVGNPFIYFINYVRDVNWDGQAMKDLDTYKLMFFVMQQAKLNDVVAETNARNKTNLIVDQFLSRMRHDSKNGEAVFKSGFDRIKNVRIVPHKIPGNNMYVGWQVSVQIAYPWEKCYDDNDWNP